MCGDITPDCWGVGRRPGRMKAIPRFCRCLRRVKGHPAANPCPLLPGSQQVPPDDCVHLRHPIETSGKDGEGSDDSAGLAGCWDLSACTWGQNQSHYGKIGGCNHGKDRFSGLSSSGLLEFSFLVKENDRFVKRVLTPWRGGPYKPLTQRGRRAAGANEFALK